MKREEKDYSSYHEGIENAPVMTKLVRPYPQAIGGELLSYTFDRTQQRFEMIWEQKAEIEGELYGK
ncbi:MAG: hypothetical protein ACRCW2_06565 [Cellulosilyticaceae bacterium]